MTEVIYQVAPRYTSGSPAQVDEATARRVAKEEQEAFAYNEANGIQSPGRSGLDGIAEALVEQRHCWHVQDLITGKESTRPFAGTTADTCQDPIPERKRRLVRDLRNLARTIIEAEVALVGGKDAQLEDPVLDYILMDLKALRCRVTHLADQREREQADRRRGW